MSSKKSVPSAKVLESKFKAAVRAVRAARILESRALKCLTIAQRMLPGEGDDVIEAQATDLMYMPESRILATLQRQTDLAQKHPPYQKVQ